MLPWFGKRDVISAPLDALSKQVILLHSISRAEMQNNRFLGRHLETILRRVNKVIDAEC